MQDILTENVLLNNMYDNIDPRYLKICSCEHILTHLYAKSLEVYKSNINWLCLILGIKRKFHYLFVF